MNLKMTRDKKLPQTYIEGCVTDKEMGDIEGRLPKDLFAGLTSNQVRDIALYATFYTIYLRDQEKATAKEKKTIILPFAKEAH